MAASLERRVRVLEDAGGGGECPRCSGVVEIRDCGERWSATKYGRAMTEEEYLAHAAEEGPDGECPVCKEKPIEIKVGWPEE